MTRGDQRWLLISLIRFTLRPVTTSRIRLTPRVPSSLAFIDFFPIHERTL